MPYDIKYMPKSDEPNGKGKGRPYKIWNRDKRKCVGSSVTKKDAESSIRARLVGEFRGRR